MAVEFFIGRRYLRSKQKQAFISLITILSIAGVTVGVMALIIVIAVMAGFESDLKERMISVESHLVLQRHLAPFTEYEQILNTVIAEPGVEAATPFVLSQIMLRAATGVSGGLLRGVDLASATDVIQHLQTDLLASHMAKRETNPDLPPGLLLGKELAGNLGIAVGDTVHLISPRGMISPIGHVPAMKRFQVVGLFESGLYEYDAALAFVSLEDAQKMLRMQGAVTGIEIRVTDIYNVQKIREQLIEKLGFPYWAKDWMQKNSNLFSALKLEKTVMFIILALIVMVAAFNIASSLIMMVMEKKKDIAILRTMGATNQQIRRIFVFKGMAIGAIGTSLGAVLGIALCGLLARYRFIELPSDVYYITTLPVQLQWLDVLSIALAALGICFLATIYPARQASKLDPVEAIRNA